MRILIVTPAKRHSRLGNRITANRWAAIISGLGHRVQVREQFVSGSFDLLIALHACRSANSIAEYACQRPTGKIVVALTGTDVNRDLQRKRAVVEQSLHAADRIVLLQPNAGSMLKPVFRKKTFVIWQSAVPLKQRPTPLKTVFEVSVLGHLRPVKDPFRAAIAARDLPDSSRVRVVHFGSALTSAMEKKALAETANNPRYHWFGSVSHGVAQYRLARSRVTVLSSESEGGPSAISEAIVNRVPILTTRINATTGILGPDYPGFFEFRDTAALTRLILQSETDVHFLNQLKTIISKIRRNFTYRNEVKNWEALLSELRPP